MQDGIAVARGGVTGEHHAGLPGVDHLLHEHRQGNLLAGKAVTTTIGQHSFTEQSMTRPA